MPHSDDFAAYLDRERSIDRARLSFAAREVARCRGVAWSGLDPTPAPPRPEAQLLAAARTRQAAAQDWGASPQGSFLCAVVQAQKTLGDAYAAAERARAAAARNLLQERDLCAEVLAELQAQSRALARSLRAAHQALRASG